MSTAPQPAAPHAAAPHPAAAALDVEAALAQLRSEGYARLGRIATDDTVRELGARAHAIMQGELVVDGLFFQHDATSGRYEDLAYGEGWVGPSLGYRKLEKLERDAAFRAWIQNPLYARLAHTWYGGEVSVYRAALFNKAATGGTALPWHQDGGRFWGLDRDPSLQVWLALDDAPAEAGCVELVPRSHEAGLATPLGGTVPGDRCDLVSAERLAIQLPARAGEGLLIHNHAWHRSGVNTTGRPRRALTVCFMDGQTRCLRQKRAPREFYRPWPGGAPGAAR